MDALLASARLGACILTSPALPRIAHSSMAPHPCTPPSPLPPPPPPPSPHVALCPPHSTATKILLRQHQLLNCAGMPTQSRGTSGKGICRASVWTSVAERLLDEHKNYVARRER